MENIIITKEAKGIYKKTISKADSSAQKALKLLFEVVARSNGDKKLSRKEALRVQALLDNHNQTIAAINKPYFKDCYELAEVRDALHVYQDWEKVRTHRFKGSERIRKLKDFIRQHPFSNKIVQAKYLLAGLYRANYDFKKAVTLYEEIMVQYPQLNQGKDAIRKLVYLFDDMGEEKKAVQMSQKWLKLEPYDLEQPMCAPGLNYKSVQRVLILVIAEYHRSQNNLTKAKDLYQQIVRICQNSRDPYYAKNDIKIARGALASLEGRKDQNLSSYHEYRAGKLVRRANYFLYDLKEREKAKEMYQETLNIVKSGYYYEVARGALAYLKLPQPLLSTEIDKVLEDLEKKKEIEVLIRYDLGYLYQSAFDLKLHLKLLLLKSCQDVTEVKLISVKEERQNSSAKYFQQSYYIAFRKTDGSYQRIGGDQKVSPQNSQTFSFEWKRSFLYETLQEFSARDNSYLTNVLLQIEKGLNDLKVKNLIKKLGNNIMGKNKKKKLLAFASAAGNLPDYYTSKLRKIDLNWEDSDKKFTGQYRSGERRVDLGDSLKETATHELAHHWQDTLIKYLPWLNNLWLDISWIKKGVKSCSRVEQECGNWSIRRPYSSVAFARKYGEKDGFEDNATAHKSYVYQTGNLARDKIRDHHNPRAILKYLFRKYIASFDPKDGRVFEYKITKESPSFTFKEADLIFKTLEKENPKFITPLLRGALARVKGEYDILKEKSKRFQEGLPPVIYKRDELNFSSLNSTYQVAYAGQEHLIGRVAISSVGQKQGLYDGGNRLVGICYTQGKVKEYYLFERHPVMDLEFAYGLKRISTAEAKVFKENNYFDLIRGMDDTTKVLGLIIK